MGGIKNSGSRLDIKLERKVIEKNRRNQMKSLFNHLYSLVPPNFIPKKGCQVSDRVDRTIDYIQTLKNNLEMSKIKKEKLLREKRSQEQTKIHNVCCKSLDIQINQISHDLDAVLVTGLNCYSCFHDVVRFLDSYSTEIEAEDVCKRLKNLADGSSNMKELCDASFCNEVDQDLSIWDYDFQSSVWECELGMIFNASK